MIAFCTQCWTEVDSKDKRCRHCGMDFSKDSRSYEEKLIAGLDHPLPEARSRMCWLLGDKKIVRAVPRLVEVAQHDEDLFVRRGAIEALGKLYDMRALPPLKQISEGENHFLRTAAKASIANIEGSRGSHR